MKGPTAFPAMAAITCGRAGAFLFPLNSHVRPAICRVNLLPYRFSTSTSLGAAGDNTVKPNRLQREYRPNVIKGKGSPRDSESVMKKVQTSQSTREWDRIRATTSSVEERLVAAEEAARIKRTGQAQVRLRKAVRREDRISVLEAQRDAAAAADVTDTTGLDSSDSDAPPGLTKAEEAELGGLLAKRAWFEEQYDESSFSDDHRAFKDSHNDAFIALSRYCQKERQRLGADNDVDPINIFFLDGPEAGTARALVDKGGFSAAQCYVANRHESTCNSLRISGGGILPERNVVHATAAEALSPSGIQGIEQNDLEHARKDGISHDVGSFADIDFAAYYFDGCGGFAPHVANMMVAALLRDNDSDHDASSSLSSRKPPIAVGFSLVGGNRDVVDKEVAVCQRLSILARRLGMRLTHVFDDPTRFGVDPALCKIGGTAGGTLTTWVVLE